MKPDPLPFSEYTIPTYAWDRSLLRRISYREFLKTDFWIYVRDEVRRRAHYRCELCFSIRGLQVHHKTYEHHGFEDMWLIDLICLCRNCHAKFHDKLPAAQDAPVTPARPGVERAVASWAKTNQDALAAEALHLLKQLDPTRKKLHLIPRLKTTIGTQMGLNSKQVGILFVRLRELGVLDTFGDHPRFSLRFRQV